METALTKMALVEKTKSTKYESMSKILDAIIDENDGCNLVFLNTYLLNNILFCKTIFRKI